MTPLQIALGSFAGFVVVGLIVKVAIGRWMTKSGSPTRDCEGGFP